MQDLPSNVLTLAGLTLAHAVWSVSDTAPDELLTPLAFVEAGGQRQLIRFEAETQAEAIEQGKATLAANADRLDAWAYAREGSWRPRAPEDAAEDVLTVEFCGGTMPAAAAILQPFARATGGTAFRLLGPPAVVVSGHIADEATTAAVRDALTAGINAHPGAAELWPAWQTGGAPRA